ncbi:hypothetical protein QYF36_009038 [Acer negundo]|nr:hypothetical protein QYF36_009038 [Acer negundo]
MLNLNFARDAEKKSNNVSNPLNSKHSSSLPCALVFKMEDFQYGGAHLERWTSVYPIPTITDLALSSLLKKQFPLKLSLLIFLEEFSPTFFSYPRPQNPSLDRLIETLRIIIQFPVDNFQIAYSFKEQIMISSLNHLYFNIS